jgi:hypothetical protein
MKPTSREEHEQNGSFGPAKKQSHHVKPGVERSPAKHGASQPNAARRPVQDGYTDPGSLAKRIRERQEGR